MAILTTDWITGSVATNIPEELFGGQDWTNPNGALSTSTASVASNEVSKIATFSRTNYLLASGFTWNFTIEDFYTIVAVRYRFTRRCTNNPTSSMRSYEEKLYYDGAAIGNNLAVFTNYPAAYGQYEGGGDIATIGAAITPAMVNDPSFGFYVGAQNNNTNTGTAEVYQFQMQLDVDDTPAVAKSSGIVRINGRVLPL